MISCKYQDKKTDVLIILTGNDSEELRNTVKEILKVGKYNYDCTKLEYLQLPPTIPSILHSNIVTKTDYTIGR